MKPFAGTNTASRDYAIEAHVLSLTAVMRRSLRKEVRAQTGAQTRISRASGANKNSLTSSTIWFTGTAYLCMKTVERAHKPATLWHRVALDKNYVKALKQVDGILTHWSVHALWVNYSYISSDLKELLTIIVSQVTVSCAQEQATPHKDHTVFHEDTQASSWEKVRATDNS